MKIIRSAISLLLLPLLFSCFPNKDFFDGERAARLTEILVMPSSINFGYVPPPDYYDLSPSAASLSATILTAGSSYTADYTVLNVGGQATPDSFNVKLCLSSSASTSSACDSGDYTLVIDTITEPVYAGTGVDRTGISVTVPPATPAGAYYLCIAVNQDYSLGLEESFSNNGYCSSSASYILPASGIDLKPQAITISDSPVMSGESYTVDYTVQNIGTLDTGGASFDVKICMVSYSYQDCSSGYLLGTDTVPETIAGGGAASVTHTAIPVTIPVLSHAGYYLCVEVDVNSAIGESDENNNTYCTSPKIWADVPDIDLRPTAITISSSTVNMGGSYTLDYTVENSGSVDAPPGQAFETDFYLSSDTYCYTSDKFLGTDTISVGVAAGGSVNRTAVPITIPQMSTGDHYLCAMVNVGKTVAESDETNNILVIDPATVTVLASQIDLVPVSATLSNTTVEINTSHTVDYTVQNQGTLPFSSDFDVKIFLSTSSSCSSTAAQIGTDTITGGLASGGSVDRTGIAVNIPPMEGGNFYFCVKADWNSKIPETDDSNNYNVSGPITVTIPTDGYEPDDSVAAVAAAAPIPTDGTVQDRTIDTALNDDYIKLDVTNTDVVYIMDTTGNCVTDLRITLLDTDGSSQLDYTYGVGSCKKLEYAFAATGTYYIKVEGYYSSTTGPYSIMVTTRPAADLTIEINSVNGNGSQVTINYTVYNIGSGDATYPSFIYVYGWDNLSVPPLVGDFGLGQDFIYANYINANGGSFSGQVTVYSSLLGGTAYVTVDHSDWEVESDETNNVSAGFSW